MTINNFFKILETRSSVINKLPFKRYFRFTPGYFFMLLFFTMFLLSGILDIIFINLMVFKDNKFRVSLLFSVIAWGPGIFTIIFNISHIYIMKQENLPALKWYHYCLIFTGLLTVNIRGISMKRIFGEQPEECRILFPLFHIPNEVLATLKIHYFFFAVSKSVPLLFAIPGFLVTYKVNEWTALVGQTTILYHMVLLSLTMAVLFPVRKSPRYFPSLSVAFLSTLSKFFGTMCACGLRVIVFTETYKTIGLNALIIEFFRIGLSLWPSVKCLYEECPNHYFYIMTYAPFMGTVFSFLYIHPFSFRGRLYYYFIYLLNFLIDVFSLYILTKGNYECAIIVVSLTIILAACMGSFGLINNIFHKNSCKMICSPEKLISTES